MPRIGADIFELLLAAIAGTFLIGVLRSPQALANEQDARAAALERELATKNCELKTLTELHAKKAVESQQLEKPESDDEKKVRLLRPWIGRQVKLTQVNTGSTVRRLGSVAGVSYVELQGCDDFGAKVGNTRGEVWSRRIPLANITISFDDTCQMLDIHER